MKTMPLSLLASSTLWYLYKIVYILPIYSHLEQLAPMIDEFKCQVRVLSNELKIGRANFHSLKPMEYKYLKEVSNCAHETYFE